MNIQQLEYVVALDRYRHFVTAAESCHVTQPTLTMQLQKLEEEIGVLIFDRTKKPLRPTPEGELIVVKARQILRDVGDLTDTGNVKKMTIEGEFRLGVIPTVAPYLIPLFLGSFIEENPDTIFRIEEMESENIIKALKEDRLDLAILATPVEEKDLNETVVYFESFLLYAPENHQILQGEYVSAGQLEASKVLLLTEGHCFRNQALNLCSERDDEKNQARFYYEIGSIEALKSLVKRNMGYTLVPELSVSEQDAKYIKRFETPEPVREISIVTHRSFNRQLLIDKLKASIRASLPEGIVTPKEFVKVKWR